MIDALNRIIDITVPEFNTMGGTRVIPGHGRIANEIDVVEYRDMLTIIRDRVMAVAEEGGTLEGQGRAASRSTTTACTDSRADRGRPSGSSRRPTRS